MYMYVYRVMFVCVLNLPTYMYRSTCNDCLCFKPPFEDGQSILASNSWSLIVQFIFSICYCDVIQFIFSICYWDVSIVSVAVSLICINYTIFQSRINAEFEKIFETGVDEMCWDDTVSMCHWTCLLLNTSHTCWYGHALSLF